MATSVDRSPIPHNYTGLRNDSWVESFTFKDKATQDPINLTLYTVIAQVRKKAGMPVILEAVDGDGLAIEGADNNTLKIFKTIAALPGEYIREIQLTRISDGYARTYIKGTFLIVDDVAREVIP